MLARIRALDGGTMDDDILIGDAETGTQTAVESGTPFPLDPNDGDLFDLSADLTVAPSEYYGPARYWYDETLGDWYRNPITFQRAAPWPNAGGEVLGDELYRTDLDIWYRWTGAWTQMNVAATVVTGTLSATQLKKGIQPFDSSVLVEALRVVASATVTLNFDQDNGAGKTQITASAGTPFSDFAVGDIIVIQNSEPDATGARVNDATGKIVDTVNVGGQGITLTNTVVGGVDNADDETMIVSVTDAVKWTGANPAVWFADGTNQNIANGSVTGLTLDNTYWAIFTVGAGVSLTNTYANAVSDTVGIIARVTTRTGEEPLIFPVFNRQKSTTLDFLGAGAIDTHTLTAEALIGKIMKTSEGVSWIDGAGDPGVIITRNGIKGKGAAGILQTLMQSTDGTILAGGGNVVLDATGVLIKGLTAFRVANAAGGVLGGVTGAAGAGTTVAVVAAAGNNLALTSDQQIGINSVNSYIVISPDGGDLVLQSAGANKIDLRLDIIPNAAEDLGTAIKPFGTIYGIDVYGRVRYSDLRSTDLTCVRCGERFKKGQSLIFEVKGYEPDRVHGEEMLSLPIHAQCPIIPRVRKWVHGLLR